MKLDTAREAEEDDIDQDVVRATPLGKRSVELMLSSLQVWSEERFLRLSRKDRHNAMLSTAQHTTDMRFDHFLARAYTENSFVRKDDGSWQLRSNFGRRPTTRRHRLDFLATLQVPSLSGVTTGRFDCNVGYDSYVTYYVVLPPAVARGGNAVVSTGETRGADSHGASALATLLAALLREMETRRLVQFVTTHSFRSGLAGDLHRAGETWKTIGEVCRWKSISCIRLYSERPSLYDSRTSQGFRVCPRSG